MVPDSWLVLSVSCRSALELEKCSGVMFDFGATAVEEINGDLITYFLPPDNLGNFLNLIRMDLNEGLEIEEMFLAYSWQRHEDWSHLWKRGFLPKKISKKLVVKPSWCATESQEDVVTVVIDPGMAFGTAEHPTTRGALRLVEKALSPGQKIMDVGCGSGILTIAAIRLGASHVLSLDSDPYAIEATSANLQRNGIVEKVNVQLEKASQSWLENNGEWEGIVANIQSDTLLPLIDGFKNALNKQGWLVLSGIMADEWTSILSRTEECKFNVRGMDAEKGWISAWFESGG